MDKIITTTIETLIKIPYKHIFSWKQYIIKDWHQNNLSYDNFIIIKILDVKQISNSKNIQQSQFQVNFEAVFELKIEAYQIPPGMMIDIKDMKVEIINSMQTNSLIKQKIKLGKDQISCVRHFNKMSDSTLYHIKQNNSIYKAQKDVYYYFILEQVQTTLQAFTFSVEQGLVNYDYEKKVIKPFIKKDIKPILIQQKYDLDIYDIKTDYDLEDFKKWGEEKKQILVPKERVDNTILVSKIPESCNVKQSYAYENLYWLIQYQQNFINQQVGKVEKTEKVEKTGGIKKTKTKKVEK